MEMRSEHGNGNEMDEVAGGNGKSVRELVHEVLGLTTEPALNRKRLTMAIARALATDPERLANAADMANIIATIYSRPYRKRGGGKKKVDPHLHVVR